METELKELACSYIIYRCIFLLLTVALQCVSFCCTAKSISHQFSSVTQSCLTPCDPMNRSTPGPPVHHQLPESTRTHVHRVGDAIQPSHHLSARHICISPLFRISFPFRSPESADYSSSCSFSTVIYFIHVCVRAKSLQLCLILCDPMDCSLPGSSVNGDSPGKNTGVGCHALLQRIFPTQVPNPRLLCLLH